MMMRLYFRGNECCVYLWIKLIIDNNNKPIFVPLFKLQYWKDKLSNKVLNQTIADAKASEYIERMITFPFYGTEVFWNLALSVSVPNLILPSKMFLEGQGQVFSYFFFKSDCFSAVFLIMNQTLSVSRRDTELTTLLCKQISDQFLFCFIFC